MRVKGFFLVFDSALTYIDGADLTTAASTRLVFPKVSATSDSSTEISFVNIGSQRLPSVRVQLYENDGRLRAGTVLDVGAYSGFSGNITQLVPEATDFEGYAVIESDLAGGSGSETLVGFETYRNISDVAALNAMGAGAELRTGYLAHLASRGGYTTRLGLVNNTAQSQVVRITAEGLESGGEPLAPRSITIELTIPAFGRIEETVEAAFDLQGEALVTGYIRYDVVGETRGLIGYLDYGTDNGVLLSAVPAQGRGFSDLFFSHVAEGLGFYTGLAFLNPHGQRTSITLDVFDRDANRVASTNLSLEPGERRARLMNELIPSLTDQLGGYVRVTASRPIFSFQLFGSRTSMDFLANVPAQGTLLAPQGSGRTVVADTGANVIATDGSASIVVPPGALTVDTEIDLTGVELVTLPDPSASERVVAAVEAQPSGTHCDIPVKLTFSLAVQLDPNTVLPLLIFDPETRTYELSEFVAIVDESGRAASADVTHFTTFTAGQPTAQLLEVSAVVPASGIKGSSVTVEGAGFAPSVDGNTVTFAGADNASVVAEVTGASTNSLSVIVPEGAVTGNVIVEAGDRSSVGVHFTVPQDNPVPVISLLTPASIPLGTTSVEIQIAGSGFNESSTVIYDDIPVASTLVDANLLRIEVVGSRLTAAFHEVVVSNPTPGGGTSNPEEFTVGFPVPTVSSLTPLSAALGALVEVTISGADFTGQSIVVVDGSPVDATFQNSTTLSFQLTAAEKGARFVSVSNPSPGGGVSNTATFDVNDKPTGPVLSVLPVPSSEMVATDVQIELEVRDSAGQPLSGVEVGFNVELGNGSVVPSKASSDGAGRVQVILTLGTSAGTNRIVGETLGVTSEPIEVMGTAGVASRIAGADGNEQSAVKGSPLPIPLTVEATDEFGNPVAGVRVVFTAGDGFGSIEPPAGRFTGDDGLVSTVATLGTLGVFQTFLVTSSDLSGSPLIFRATASDSPGGGGGGGGGGGSPSPPAPDPAPVNQSPTANAGTDQTLTSPAVANLSGTATDDGFGGTTLTTTWSTVNGPGTVTFVDASAAATTAAFSLDGTYVLRLTASDGTLTATDELTITVNPANQSPTANAGTDQTLTLPALANLAGTATDDGVGPTTLTTTWSMVSGPGTVTFLDASAAATTAAFSVDGTYVLRLTATDGALTATDELTITVNPANQSPTANAGTDQTLTLPALANLTGTATDDGVGPTTLTTTWSMVSGPGTVTFLDASALATTAAFSADGTYVLRMTVSDGTLTATDELTITVNPANQSPTANAGTDQTLTLPALANLAGTATDDGVGGTTLTTTWSMVSGPGTVTFLDASALATTAAFSVDGTYVLRLTVSDGTLTATDELTITVNPANQSPTGVKPILS